MHVLVIYAIHGKTLFSEHSTHMTYRKQHLIDQVMGACIRSDHSYSTWIVSNNITE